MKNSLQDPVGSKCEVLRARRGGFVLLVQIIAESDSVARQRNPTTEKTGSVWDQPRLSCRLSLVVLSPIDPNGDSDRRIKTDFSAASEFWRILPTSKSLISCWTLRVSLIMLSSMDRWALLKKSWIWVACFLTHHTGDSSATWQVCLQSDMALTLRRCKQRAVNSWSATCRAGKISAVDGTRKTTVACGVLVNLVQPGIARLQDCVVVFLKLRIQPRVSTDCFGKSWDRCPVSCHHCRQGTDRQDLVVSEIGSTPSSGS